MKEGSVESRTFIPEGRRLFSNLLFLGLLVPLAVLKYSLGFNYLSEGAGAGSPIES
jgi:hypothetical protein